MDISKDMRNRKIHGERNKSLCYDLLSGKKYYDWVITTAFYSAIHFVEDIILPCKINNISCKSIHQVRDAYKFKGRHSTREHIVYQFLPEIGPQYKWLDDKSRYSRYTTYKVTLAEAEKAKQYLEEIYQHCYQNKAE